MHPFTLAVPIGPTDHIIGPGSAHVAVVEYGDYECPVCLQAQAAVKILLKEFNQRIRFAYRHFPIVEEHPHAELAAEAAEAAAAQGRFWLMHERILSNQRHLKLPALRRYAQAIELDIRRFDAEIADHIYLQRVQEQLQGGYASGVRGTPTFFVDGALVDYTFGAERVLDAIAAALERRQHP